MAKYHKANIILFVGAGASVPFGYQTTDEFINEIKAMSLEPSEREILDQYTKSPNITIEDIIRALDIRIKESGNLLLRQEALSPLRTMQEHTEKVEKLLGAYQTLKDKIRSQLYVAYAEKPELGKAWEVYKDYIDILREQNDRALPIFTTNYDKVIESLGDIPDSGINQVVRGFKEKKKGIPRNPTWDPGEVFDQEPQEDKIFLYKLHGSLNWRIDIYRSIRETEEGQFEMRGHWIENVLVPPGTADFQYGEPYQSLRLYFDGYLQNAQTSLVIGYRFDDITIRDYFLRSLERGLRLILLSPEAEKIKAEKFPQFENMVCIPKRIEDGAEDVKEVLGLKTRVEEPSEAPTTEPEAENPPTSAPEEV